MTRDLERVKDNESRHQVAQREDPLQSNKEPKGQWNQLYFKEPFAMKDALLLLGECIEEALKLGILAESDTCDVDRVVSDQENPNQGWQALRLTCKGVKSVSFRACVANLLQPR